MKVLKGDFLPENLVPLLKQTGFDGCVAVQASQSEAETDFLLQLAGDSSIVKGVVGWLDLQATDLQARLTHYSKHPKLCGLRHIVQDEPDDNFLLRDKFMQGITQLQKFNLTYDILVFERQLPAAVEFARTFPNQAFVLDHIAKPLIEKGEIKNWEKYIRQLGECKNVYCKLSGMVTEADWQNWKAANFIPYLKVVFEAFGTERLMIGSDWPVCLLAGNYQQVMQLVTGFIAEYTEKEQAAMLGGNACKFYQL
jgi:L-fuconolactonase